MSHRAYCVSFLLIALAFTTGFAATPAPATPAPATPAPPPDIPVLMYHRVLPELRAQDSPFMTVTTANFAADLAYLRDHGFVPVSLQDVAAAIDDAAQPLPAGAVLITFDDGYLDNFEHAFPLLQEYTTPAAMFIIGWSVGRDRHLRSDAPIIPHFTWEQARTMLASGLVAFGSHSFDLHSPAGMSYGSGQPAGLGVERLPNEAEDLYRARLRDDLRRSRREMEAELGVTVQAFAYPYGVYSETAVDVLQELGFGLAFTTQAAEPSPSRYLLRRLAVTNDVRVADLLGLEP